MRSATNLRETAKLLAGGAGLCAGLSLLGRVPLMAVLVILGAMTCTLISTARLCGVEV